MKLLWGDKDGGPESKVWCWGLEVKPLGSILLMNFKEGSREAYHTHAFNAISWILSGKLHEIVRLHNGSDNNFYAASFSPIITRRETLHKVAGLRPDNWVISFRGPWVDKWKEHLPVDNKDIILTHGRVVVNE